MGAFWSAASEAVVDLIRAVFTLLPGLIAYRGYGVFMKGKPPLSSLSPRDRYMRIGRQVLAAILISAVIAYGFSQMCPTDEESGYCLDDDWKAPTSLQNLAHFLRITFLILVGLAYAYDKKRKDPDWP